MKLLKLTVLLCFIMTSCKQQDDKAPAPSPETLPGNVLLFTKTNGYRHESIRDGVALFQSKHDEWNIQVLQTESSEDFNTENLAKYKLIVLLNTTGTLLSGNERIALQTYVESGGAVLGIHAAADAEYNWPWYGKMLGGWFESHPAIQQATCNVIPHSTTEGINTPWTRTDEWYNFKSLQSDNHVVVTIDETSYTGGIHGNNHPISWYRTIGDGKVFYTAMGHTPESYSEPNFIQHIGGAVKWLLAK